MNHIKAVVVLVIGLILSLFILTGTAHADRRNFVWTYEYKTLPAGEAEFEYYLTAAIKRPAAIADDELTFDHNLEIEYGITDHLDVSMYQLFRHKEGDNFKYLGYKLRGRYRIGETGSFFVDPLLYLEFIHKPLDHELEVEEKLILTKNLGQFLLSFNMVFSQEAKYKDELQEYSFSPTLAFGYQIKPWVSVGAEMFTKSVVVSDTGYQNTAFFAGPTISLAGKEVWWNLGAIFQATRFYDDHPRFQVRTILGINL